MGSLLSDRTPRVAMLVLLMAACFSMTDIFAYDLAIRVGSSTVPYGETQGWISLYLQNPTDSIAGYEILLRLDRPDLIALDNGVETTGTITAGFEYVVANSPSGNGTSLRIVCLADVLPLQSPQNRGFGPHLTEHLLINVPFHVLPIPDTMTERTVSINIESQFVAFFGFSRPDGTSIGLTQKIVADTSYYRCLQWLGTTCLSWQKVPSPPYDSIDIAIDTIPFIDTTAVKFISGDVTVASCRRLIQSIDIDGDGVAMTVSDLVELQRLMHGDTGSVAVPKDADLDGNCIIDWADYYVLDSLFRFGIHCDIVPCTLPCSCDHTPVRKCCWMSRGNVDNDATHMINLTDLSFLVSYLVSNGSMTLRCQEEANVNGVGIVDLSDLSFLIAYLTASQRPTLPTCP